MGKATGFMEFERSTVPYRAPLERIQDYNEFLLAVPEQHLQTQGARCMDCGVPFCQSETGCPIDNLIPRVERFSLSRALAGSPGSLAQNQ